MKPNSKLKKNHEGSRNIDTGRKDEPLLCNCENVISKRYHFLFDLMKRMKILIQVSPYPKLMN